MSSGLGMECWSISSAGFRMKEPSLFGTGTTGMAQRLILCLLQDSGLLQDWIACATTFLKVNRTGRVGTNLL